MNRLLEIALMLMCVTNGHLARVPKIYNALITSDENLSPSQAYPIIEPVLRTTALGVAFPPLAVHPQIYSHHPRPTLQLHQQPHSTNAKEDTPAGTAETTEDKKQQKLPPQLTYHGSLYPLAYDPYLPYGYHHDFLYPPLLPFYHQQPVYVDFGHYESNSNHNNNNNGNGNNANRQEEENSNVKQVLPLPPQIPPQSAINFKKNPDIPDVIPPLPIRNERKRDS